MRDPTRPWRVKLPSEYGAVPLKERHEGLGS